jgi:hypothetical protein
MFLFVVSWSTLGWVVASGEIAVSATLVERIESPVSVAAWSPYPTAYEINTWMWLTDSRQKYGRNVNLSSVPSAEWERHRHLRADAVVKSWQLIDAFSGVMYERDAAEIRSPGLNVELGPWSYHFSNANGCRANREEIREIEGGSQSWIQVRICLVGTEFPAPAVSLSYPEVCLTDDDPGIQKSGPDRLIWNKLFVGAARGVVPVSS